MATVDERKIAPRHLQRLADLDEDFPLDSYDADVRGWLVIGSDQIVLGHVADLVVERDTGVARYLEIETGGALPEHGRHLLIPIDMTEADLAQQKVVLHGIDHNMIFAWPAYLGGPIEADYEFLLREKLNRAGISARLKPQFFSESSFEEEDLYGGHNARKTPRE